MKKPTVILLLLLLPCALFISSLIYKNSKGEFFLNSQYDPSYPYLINSLNLSSSIENGIRLYEHPGTTTIVTGSLVIYLLHIGNDEDIVADVFNRPEFYLDKINLVFLILNFTALFILGIVAYSSFENINSALLLQLTPFLSVTTYFWITNVSPEPLLIFSVLLFITVIVSFISNKNQDSKSAIKYIFAFGVICGFGLATKISFFPLLLIPLILIKRIPFKILFCLITGTFFLIFIIPVIAGDHSIQYVKWLKNLITHSGKYGTGESNFVNTPAFFKNLKTIFIKEPVFGFSYLMILSTFFFQFLPKFKQRIREHKYFRLLNGIFIAMTIQIIIVCKHFELHYLIPAYLLIVLGLFVVNSIADVLFPSLFKKKKLIYLNVIMIIILCCQIPAFMKSASYYSGRRDASRDFIQNVEKNYSQKLIVSSYGASGQDFALYLGAVFGGTQKNNYYSVIKSMFPEKYYYDKWSKNLENVENLNTLKNKLNSSKDFIFLCDNETTLKEFMNIVTDVTGKQNVNFKKAFSNSNGETVYEIVWDPN